MSASNSGGDLAGKDAIASVEDRSGLNSDERSAFLSSFTRKEEESIMRKVDRRFLLLVGLMYLIKTIDYSNASNVKVLQAGDPRNILIELDMTADQYNWVQSIYFISYIIFEVPSNLLLKKFTPRLWQSRIMVTWGVVLACHAAVKNRQGLYTARFILGMMEAGMFPGIVAQLCSWYRSDEMGKPIMWMFGLQNCSGIVGSIVAYGISYMNGKGGLSAWRWVYLLEGIFTSLFGIVVYLVLPDYPKSPRSQSWLTPREQSFLEVRLSENAPMSGDAAFSKAEIMASLKDPKTYAFMLCQMFLNMGGYGLSWYLPTITTNLGFAGLPRNQLLNIPPAAASVLAIIFAGWFMKRAYTTRATFIGFIMAGAVIMFALLVGLDSRGGIYAACILGTMFYSVYFIPLWAWRSATLKGSTGAAFTLAFQSSIGQVGGVVGPQLFLEKWSYNGYKNSFAICLAMVVAACFANIWAWWLTRGVENEVLLVRRARIKAERGGGVYAGDDVRV